MPDKWEYRGWYWLFRAMNCAQATAIALEEYSDADHQIIKALTNLEGGGVGMGATCGVLSSGILNMGLVHLQGEKPFYREDIPGDFYTGIREYTSWFREKHETSFCRERTGIDFTTLSGQMRYFVPGDRLGRCFSHIGQAVSHLGNSSFLPKSLNGPLLHVPCHCAPEILLALRSSGKEIPEELINASIGFDGGIGLSGGLCGALAGGIMALGLSHGTDPKKDSFLQTTISFIRGHMNILQGASEPKDKEPFFISATLFREFEKRFGSPLCSKITGHRFTNGEDFSVFIEKSDTCRSIFREVPEMVKRLLN